MKYLTLALATLLLFVAVLVLSERVVSLEARLSAHESAAIDSNTLVGVARPTGSAAALTEGTGR